MTPIENGRTPVLRALVAHVAVLSFYFFSMAIHYGLSVYWFNGMTNYS